MMFSCFKCHSVMLASRLSERANAADVAAFPGKNVPKATICTIVVRGMCDRVKEC